MQTLRLFCDVARHRSFSKAAAEHHITQSAASQRISQLEKRLGVSLIDRSVRPFALTPAGDRYLKGVQAMLDGLDKLDHEVSGMGDASTQDQSRVVVDAIYSAGIDLLNQLKDAFVKTHPKINVVIEYKRPEEVHEAVVQRRCDIGIVSYPQRWKDVGVIALRDEPMAVVVAPGHPLTERRRVHASDLDRWAMMAFEPELPVARAIRRYLKEHDGSPQVSHVFDNIDTIKTAVAVTDRFAILPRRTVLREVMAGTLALVELSPRLLRPIGILHAKGPGASLTSNGHSSPSVLRPQVRSFVEYLIKNAGPESDLIGKLEKQARVPASSAKN
ncbi:MAG: LysR family transcriptional regulator [Phycisphaera sp.]|nr:LysR family transcriptional regulator [Phycisphaera sp.]